MSKNGEQASEEEPELIKPKQEPNSNMYTNGDRYIGKK